MRNRDGKGKEGAGISKGGGMQDKTLVIHGIGWVVLEGRGAAKQGTPVKCCSATPLVLFTGLEMNRVP